jgi:hypothetical protein
VAGFMYFVEDSDALEGETISLDLLERKNLTARPKRSIPSHAIHDWVVGPNSKKGHFLYFKTAGKPPVKQGYNANSQVWIDRGDLWVGWDKSNLPTPQDLVKPSPIGGWQLKDQTDREWILPLLRSPVVRDTLPVDFTFDNDGKVLRVRKPGFEAVWDLAGEATDYLLALGEVDGDTIEAEYSEQWVITSAIEFMAINYYLGPHEVSAFHAMGLPILDEAFAHAVFHAVTDFGHVQLASDYIEKKNEIKAFLLDDQQRPSHGSTESCPETTGPHTVSSLSPA